MDSDTAVTSRTSSAGEEDDNKLAGKDTNEAVVEDSDVSDTHETEEGQALPDDEQMGEPVGGHSGEKDESSQETQDPNRLRKTKASQTAIDFLENVNPELLDLCLFDDNLVTASEDGKSIGEFKTNVEKVVIDKEELLLVHASSHGKIDDTPMRTSITTYLKRKDLSVFKQEHYEFVKVPGHELEKRTEMTLSEETGQLLVNRRITQGDRMKRNTFKIPKEKLPGFVTEGTNVVLERLLIKLGKGYENLSFVALDPESSRLVPTTYTTMPVRKQQIGSKEISVSGIERKLQSIEGMPQTWQSYFMDDGHLTMRIQIGSPMVATVEKVPRRVEPEVFEPKPVFEKQPLDWENDMEMKSRFLQRKEELKAGHQTYLRQHPEASALLADFFQFLLLRKPDDVFSFASDFFASFSNTFPDTSSYSHSAPPDDPAPATIIDRKNSESAPDSAAPSDTLMAISDIQL